MTLKVYHQRNSMGIIKDRIWYGVFTSTLKILWQFKASVPPNDDIVPDLSSVGHCNDTVEHVKFTTSNFCEFEVSGIFTTCNFTF